MDDKSAAAAKPAEGGLPAKGKAIKITALGNAQRSYKGKLITNQGIFVTPEGEGFNHSLVEEIRKDKDPYVAAGFAIENFEDGKLVVPKK